MATPGHAFYSPLAADVGGSLNWLFFAAGNILGAVDPRTPLNTVTRLWRLASAPDASVESVVAAVPTRGPEAVGSFAIAVVGTRVTIVVRGAGSVDVHTAGGQRRVDSRNMQPWYLAEFDSFAGLTLGSVERSIGVDTGPSGSDLPLLSGIVRAPWLAWTPTEIGSERQSDIAESRPTAPPPGPFRGSRRPATGPTAVLPTAPSAPITGSIPVQELAVAPGVRGSAITTPIPVIPVAAVPVTATRASAVPAASAAAASAPDPAAAASSAAPEPATEPATAPATDGGGTAVVADTGAGHGLEESDPGRGDTMVIVGNRHRAAGSPLTSWNPGRMDQDPRFAPGQTDFSAPRYYGFRIGDGQAFRLDTPVYIGRKPSTPRIVTGTLPRLIRVPSPSMEVSSTHLEIRQEGNSVVLTDMRSTNGTYVSQPGANHLKLRQGESMVVAPGTIIDIGDGNVIEILPVR